MKIHDDPIPTKDQTPEQRAAVRAWWEASKGNIPHKQTGWIKQSPDFNEP